MASRNIIATLTFNFSLNAIRLVKELVARKEFLLARQLLRSATSIGANVEEASAAQSTKDFVSKMSIASKEARETRYWLRLLSQGNLVDVDLTSLLHEIEVIIKILTKIVKTTQARIAPLPHLKFKT